MTSQIAVAIISAIVSSLLSLTAIMVSVYYNQISHKQYLRSLDPELSFRLNEFKGYLYMKVTNHGKSAAQKIKITIKNIEDNGGCNDLMLDPLFKNEFEFYLEESTRGRIAVLGESLNKHAFPRVLINVSYEKYISKEIVEAERTVIFTLAYIEKVSGDINVKIKGVDKSIETIARANIRTANYLDGCRGASFDECNIITDRTLCTEMENITQKYISVIKSKRRRKR